MFFYLFGVVVVVVVFIVVGVLFVMMLLFAFVLFCPIMMFMMMRGMSGGMHDNSEDHTGHGCEHDPTRQPVSTSAPRR